MINKRIIIDNGDSTVDIVAPSLGYTLIEGSTMEALQAETVPEGLSSRIGNLTDLPSDKYFRFAWTDDVAGEQIDVDMLKARDIHMDSIRVVRNKKLADLGIPQIIAVETNDTVTQDALIIEKQILRDIPQTFDLTTATTPEELKSLWPEELK